MFFEADVCAIADLFVPRQPISMRVDARNDVVEAISIHIIYQHLSAALAATEFERVMFPLRVTGQRCRLFPPAIFIENVCPSIPIYVAGSDPVGVALPAALRRYRMELPWQTRIFPIGSRISHEASRAAEDIRPPIPIDIHEVGRFIIHYIQNEMPLPMSLAAFRIFIPGCVLAWKSIDENVVPAIAVEIIGEDDKCFGIGIVHP